MERAPRSDRPDRDAGAIDAYWQTHQRRFSHRGLDPACQHHDAGAGPDTDAAIRAARAGTVFGGDELVQAHEVRVLQILERAVEMAKTKADVLVMGHILHDWNLEEKKRLLAKAHAALSPGGALVAYDSIIDDDRRENAFGLLMSLNMLIETPGGFDYTAADCIGWMKEAGFSSTRSEHLVGPDSMVVGIK